MAHPDQPSQEFWLGHAAQHQHPSSMCKPDLTSCRDLLARCSAPMPQGQHAQLALTGALRLRHLPAHCGLLCVLPCRRVCPHCRKPGLVYFRKYERKACWLITQDKCYYEAELVSNCQGKGGKGCAGFDAMDLVPGIAAAWQEPLFSSTTLRAAAAVALCCL
jgi:hypothetical protein